jgi:hypothetical protein
VVQKLDYYHVFNNKEKQIVVPEKRKIQIIKIIIKSNCNQYIQQHRRIFPPSFSLLSLPAGTCWVKLKRSMGPKEYLAVDRVCWLNFQ